MALTLMLRNTVKLNGLGGFLKTARVTPLATYTTTSFATRQNVAAAKSAPLVKISAPTLRSISVSAPKLSSSQTNHATLWSAEKMVSLALLGVIPGAFMYPSQALDAALAVSVVLHTHWGVENIITDYMREQIYGKVLPKVFHGILIILSVASLGGLFYFIYNDIGIAKSVQQVWAIQGYVEPPPPEPVDPKKKGKKPEPKKDDKKGK